MHSDRIGGHFTKMAKILSKNKQLKTEKRLKYFIAKISKYSEKSGQKLKLCDEKQSCLLIVAFMSHFGSE
jgi:hypothetical protein